MSSRPSAGHVRLATASPAPHPTGGVKATLRDLAAIASRASSSLHADILLLPEAYLGGYPRGSAFGAVVGERTAEGREEFRKYFRGAVDLGDVVGEAGAGGGERWMRRQLHSDGGRQSVAENGADGFSGSAAQSQLGATGDGTREELERIARETGVFLVVGVVERAGGSLYCAVVYVDPARGIIGKRRKVMPTGSERLIWAQGAPSTLRAVSTWIRGVRVNLAAAICWENYMPMLRSALYAQNVNLYLAPTADGRDAWASLMRSVGVEGRCFVVSSNMAVRKGGADSEAAPATAHARARRGSCITEDGHEIVLPTSPNTDSKASSPVGSRRDPSRKRRKSVIVEDGNEIVLGCDENGNRVPADHGLHGASGDISPTTTTSAAVDPSQVEKQSQQQQKAGKPAWASRGGSCIVNPFGDVLAGPQWEDDEGIIWADVDFEDCVRGRLDLDAGGSYSRNDSFKFSVEGLNLDPLPY